MKRIIYIILLTFSFTGVFAQEEEKLYTFCKNFRYQEIEDGLNDFQKKSTNKIKYQWQNLLERELVNDFFEQNIKFTKSVKIEGTTSNYTLYNYNLKLIKKKDGKIAFYKLIRLKNIKSKEKWIPKEIILSQNSNQMMRKLESKFEEVYSYPLNHNELFESEIVYGRVCGHVRGTPEYRRKLTRLIKLKDTKSLVKWLKSTVVEIQLYAIDGILTLKKDGVIFDKSVFKLIDIISNKKGIAKTCRRCIYGGEFIKVIVEKIKKEHNKM
ncbi:hypothetical protein [Tenacibaculum aiptasiae]|uniref:hypothetical protein n=1 Tax=Tenacibaculum aiptasiae TaxID=426481 RepID=UPI00232AC861|nr:hypothetical protein [Tenacibaculum aiptasiae]